ncbi:MULTISPECIES: DUF1893 domain-containing protein [Bacteria]|jgi:hypothetical protein|uniref:DUF1893 domain-containing protein n=1 Tax=Geotoga petraea TaxID=28234 RepID=A0A1G6KXX6_9BACT|nr:MULTISPECIES: DUF1893 domain-containing protein [Bacteria]PUU87442.1 MAG: hypothetical protein CI949_3549 [Halanaerobium sp.]TGG88775.1 DUF1893 domain-containing protein [Geotoga petraea]SDC35952.1 protein of unknown function [Geotoga petraea]
MKDIEKAKDFLEKGNYSFVAVKDGHIIAASQEDGIKPLIKIIRENKSMLKESSIADKVIGKAAALLMLYAKAKEVHGYIMSETAMEVFNDKDFPYTYDEEVKYILNKTGDDMCPMEKVTMNISKPNKAYKALEEKIKESMSKK